MSLFSNIERTFERPALRGEPHYDYLNRSCRSEMARIRANLERWWRDFPRDEQDRLKAHIQSRDDERLESASFELLNMKF